MKTEIKIINEIKKGEKYSIIALRFNISISTVCILAKKSGWGRSKKKKVFENKVLELYKKNIKQAEIARILECDYTTVWNVLKRCKAHTPRKQRKYEERDEYEGFKGGFYNIQPNFFNLKPQHEIRRIEVLRLREKNHRLKFKKKDKE